MRAECGAVGPVLEEHEAIRVFHIAVHRVQKASRFQPGAGYMLEADAFGFLTRVGARFHAARDDDHRARACCNSRGRAAGSVIQIWATAPCAPSTYGLPAATSSAPAASMSSTSMHQWSPTGSIAPS